MTISPADEAPRDELGAAFSDAVTFAFGDPAADVYGLARVGLSPDPDGGARQASGLALVFSGREVVAVRAAGGLEVTGDGWDGVRAAGVRTTVEEPLAAWTAAFESDDGTAGFELRFEATSAAAELPAGSDVTRTGGMTGYEHLCRVSGTARVRGGDRRIDCLGQRGHSWGSPDWDRIVLARTVGVWADAEHGVTLTSIRGATDGSHADEAIAATLFTPVDDALAAPVAVFDPRLSTTTDAEDRQRRAGLELWMDEDGYPLRAAGEVLCGTSLDLGRLRLDCAFFRWTFEGRVGVGRYDILRRTS